MPPNMKIYDVTVINLFKRIFNLGPRAVNTLQAPGHLNPALASCTTQQTFAQGRIFLEGTLPSPRSMECLSSLDLN